MSFGRLDAGHTKRHYYESHRTLNASGVVPVGPGIDFDGPHDRTPSRQAVSRRLPAQDTLAVRRCLATVQRSSFSLAPLTAGSIARSWSGVFAASSIT